MYIFILCWDDNDYSGFMNCTNNNIGQINMDTSIGKMLYAFAQDDNITNILEIGTWNGLGSTKCIVSGLQNRKTPYTFYSLECNEEKCNSAKNLYKMYLMYIY